METARVLFDIVYFGVIPLAALSLAVRHWKDPERQFLPAYLLFTGVWISVAVAFLAALWISLTIAGESFREWWNWYVPPRRSGRFLLPWERGYYPIRAAAVVSAIVGWIYGMGAIAKAPKSGSSPNPKLTAR